MRVKITKIPGNPLSKVIPFKNLLGGGGGDPSLMNSNIVGSDDDDITTHMKKVDRKDANLEAEKGELIMKPGSDGLYRIGGKKHGGKNGGTPLYAEPGSFIFSDDKDLAITKDEREQFNFKRGGSVKAKNNTPAKVLAREVNPKEFNRLMSIITDPTKDRISKNSAALMLEKYQQKIGQVAYLQELKKDFPNGLPEFSQETAPLKEEGLQEDEKLTESFQYGGRLKYNEGEKVGLLGRMSFDMFNMPYNSLNFFQKLEVDGRHRQSVNALMETQRDYVTRMQMKKGVQARPEQAGYSPFRTNVPYKQGGQTGFGGLPIYQAAGTVQWGDLEVARELGYKGPNDPTEIAKFMNDTAANKEGEMSAVELAKSLGGFRGKTEEEAEDWLEQEYPEDFHESWVESRTGQSGKNNQWGSMYDKIYRARSAGLDSPSTSEAAAATSSTAGVSTPTSRGYGQDPTGRWSGDRNASKNPLTGKIETGWNAMTDYASAEEYAKKVRYTDGPSGTWTRDDIKKMQRWVKGMYPDLVKEAHELWGMPAAGTEFDGYLGVRWQHVAKNRGMYPRQPLGSTPLNKPIGPITAKPPTGNETAIKPPDLTYPNIPWRGHKFKMNDLEKWTAANPGLQALSAKSFYDYISEMHSPPVRLDRVDGQQETNDVKEMGALSTREAFNNSPAGVASRMVAGIKEQSLKNMSGINARVKHMNTQISQQEDMTNYNGMVRDMQYNVPQVHQAFTSNQLTQQRAGEMRRDGFTQSLNAFSGIQGNLDNMSRATTAAGMPFITNAKNPDGSLKLVTGPDGRKYTVQGVPFGFDQDRMPVFDSQFGSLDSLGVMMSGNKGVSAEQSKELKGLIDYAIKSKNPQIMAGVGSLIRSILGSTSGKGASPWDAISQGQFNYNR